MGEGKQPDHQLLVIAVCLAFLGGLLTWYSWVAPILVLPAYCFVRLGARMGL